METLFSTVLSKVLNTRELRLLAKRLELIQVSNGQVIYTTGELSDAL